MSPEQYIARFFQAIPVSTCTTLHYVRRTSEMDNTFGQFPKYIIRSADRFSIARSSVSHCIASYHIVSHQRRQRRSHVLSHLEERGGAVTISSWTYRRISERDTYRTIGLISDNRSHTYDRHIGRSSTRTGTSSAYNTSNDRYASYDWTRYTTASNDRPYTTSRLPVVQRDQSCHAI